jgi:hypothetical protein
MKLRLRTFFRLDDIWVSIGERVELVHYVCTGRFVALFELQSTPADEERDRERPSVLAQKLATYVLRVKVEQSTSLVTELTPLVEEVHAEVERSTARSELPIIRAMENLGELARELFVVHTIRHVSHEDVHRDNSEINNSSAGFASMKGIWETMRAY